MAMNWIKGLVAPAAQFAGQQGFPPGMQQPGGPPVGGATPYGYQQGPMPVAGSNPYGNQPPPMDPMQMQQQQQWQAPQWSQGTRTQGDVGPIAGGAPAPIAGGAPAQPIAGGDRVAQLQHDVESLALFARTLLTMLEERNIVTREQFDETKRRLDMLDGKLDDR